MSGELEPAGAHVEAVEGVVVDGDDRVLFDALYGGDVDRAYDLALLGVAREIPQYAVTSGTLGEFVAALRIWDWDSPVPATPVERALVAGDVARRWKVGIAAGDGVDPFAAVRCCRWVGDWPGDAAVQGRAFPCPQCGAISHHLEDVANRYCGRCHDVTADAHGNLAGHLPGGTVLLRLGTFVGGVPEVVWSGGGRELEGRPLL